MTEVLDILRRIADLGGPVVLVLVAASVYVLAIALYKIWQFRAAGVGRHRALQAAVAAWDTGDRATASDRLSQSTSYLAPVIEMAFSAKGEDLDRLASEAATRFARLETGLGSLDTVAQLAPLLGLFGTVLGMIDAFQALQDAGTQVDPSVLAGGIWVALLTTAVGLAVAMPSALLHSWLEARMDAERVVADHAIQSVLRPVGAPGSSRELAGA